MTSVVVPVYNGEPVLERTVPAVLALTGVDEWVWVDDGSTDATRATLDRLLGTEPRAAVVSHVNNRGRGAARNTGVEATRGETVVFFDADAIPAADGALRLVDAVAEDGRRAAVARIRSVLDRPDDPYQVYLRRFYRGPQAEHGGAVAWKFFVTCACALRRDAFNEAGGFDQGIRYGEDFALGCRLRTAAPDGLGVAQTTVDLLGVGTLDSALANADAFGEALARLEETYPEAPDLAGVPPWARSPIVRRLAHAVPAATSGSLWLRALPVPIRIRTVRYLLGFALLSGYDRARASTP